MPVILKLILDILELQMKKGLRGRLHFKLSKGDDLKNSLGKPGLDYVV